jgi:hypothetical protein
MEVRQIRVSPANNKERAQMKTIHAIAVLAVSAVAIASVAQQATPTDERLVQKARMFSQNYNSSLCVVSAGCPVTVTVSANCLITVDPYTLGMPEGFTNTVITWEISGSSYGKVAFAKDGITFKSPGASQEFVNPTPGTTTFKYTDKNPHKPANPRRPYHYSVKVTQDGNTCIYDPTVINDY